MLVIKRKSGRKVYIDGGRIAVTVIQVQGDSVKLGFDAPAGVNIARDELLPQGPYICCRCGGTLPPADSTGMRVKVSTGCRGDVDEASGRCGAFVASPLWDALPDVAERTGGAA